MKSALVLMALVFSANSFAGELNDSEKIVLMSSVSILAPTALTSDVTSSGALRKEASEVIADANEYYQSGAISPRLGEHISNLQKKHDISLDEAVDTMVEIASDILK